jgi:uncharacterized protein
MLVLMPVLIPATPGLAQFSETYKFLEAARKGDRPAVYKAISEPGVTPINTKDRSTGETALMIVTGLRNMPMVSDLLVKGAKTDIQDNAGRTALHVAVEKRFHEGALMILSRGADANRPNRQGETPLILAVHMRDIEMARILLSGGADPARKDTLQGMSALDYAARGIPVPGMIDLLKSRVGVAKPKGVQGPGL